MMAVSFRMAIPMFRQRIDPDAGEGQEGLLDLHWKGRRVLWRL